MSVESGERFFYELLFDSILVFDPEGTERHLADFAQYHTLVEQRLCGPVDCTSAPFTDASFGGSDAITAGVRAAALDEQSRLGLPRAPLVANVYFPGQAAEYETLRQTYVEWLAAHEQIAAQVTAGDRAAAATRSTGQSADVFTRLEASTDAATAPTRLAAR